MESVMGYRNCFICCKQCVPKAHGVNQSNTVNGSADEAEFVDNQLQVIFLLRKLLEIPEETCCKLLKHFGHPSLWMDYCDSCSVLVEKCQTIVHQIASLEKNYNDIRMNIKNTILKSQKHFDNEYQYQCEAIVRSQIISKDIDYFIEATTPRKDKVTSPYANTEILDGMTDGLVCPEKEQYPRTDCDVILNNVDPLGTDAENINSFPQVSDDTPIDYHFTTKEFDKHDELLSGEVNITDKEYDRQEIGGCKIDIKPLGLFVEEEAIPTELSFQPSDEIENNSKAKVTIKKQPIAPKRSNRSIRRKGLANSSKPQSPKTVLTKKKLFKCDVCGKLFQYGFTLKRHSFSHSSVKPHQCDMCGQRFSQKDRLARHKGKLHTTDREYPFTCVMCGKSCIELQSLKVHYRQHTEEKNKFNCLLCGESCTRLDRLKLHNMKHSGELSK